MLRLSREGAEGEERESQMNRIGNRFLFFLVLLVLLFAFPSRRDVTGYSGYDTTLGPQSSTARGEQRVLIAVVRFPDVRPSQSLEQVRKRVVQGLNAYLKEQSYGLAWIKADFRGWVDLPDPLSEYKVSPHNYKVDRTRVRKLVEDTLTALERETDFSRYQHILIVPGVTTTPGKGYGMICYCANPGMLTGVRGKLAFATVRTKGGKEFRGGIFMGTENAHLGMFAHDFFHALGGIQDGRRLAPCLYDYDRQSDPSLPVVHESSAIYMGPWDIMSQHFTQRGEPPPGISSFTKIRLGWINQDQVVFVKPGEERYIFLSPLSKGGNTLVVKIPLLNGNYYLIENRQPIGYDGNLPDAGIVVLRVSPDVREGSGTVEVMNADPSAPVFSRAAYKLTGEKGSIYRDKSNEVAIIPLWEENGAAGVLVTTQEKSEEALRAALAVKRLMIRSSQSREAKEDKAVRDAVAAFKRFDYSAAGAER